VYEDVQTLCCVCLHRSDIFLDLNEFTEYRIIVRAMYSIASDSDELAFGLNETAIATTAEDGEFLFILISKRPVTNTVV